jgi:hypothetical protein
MPILNQYQLIALEQLSKYGVTEQHLLSYKGKNEFDWTHHKALETLICQAGFSVDDAFAAVNGKSSQNAGIFSEIIKNHRLTLSEAEQETKELNFYQLMAIRALYSFGLRRTDLKDIWKPLEKIKSDPFEVEHCNALIELIKEHKAPVDFAIRAISEVNGFQARTVVQLLKMGLTVSVAKEQVKDLYEDDPMLMAIERLYHKGLRRAHFYEWKSFVYHYSPYEQEVHEFSYEHLHTLELLINRCECSPLRAVVLLSELAKYHTGALDLLLLDKSTDLFEARSAIVRLNFYQSLSLKRFYEHGLRPQDLIKWRPFVENGKPEKFDDDHMHALEYLFEKCRESKDTAMAKIDGVSKSDLWNRKFNPISSEISISQPSVATARAAMFSQSISSPLTHIPQPFICPLSAELITDPVTASDGMTYERKAIESWLTANEVSPITKLVLKDKILVPNAQLAISIGTWLESNGRQNGLSNGM